MNSTYRQSDIKRSTMLSQLKSQQNLAGRIFLTLVLAAICGGLVNADSIVLKSGQRIDGEVLKVQKDTLFVDIGVDVIRVPVDQIAERIESKPESTTPKSNTAGIFQTADLPERTVKELVSRYGEGVVLIQTPDGLGSGFIINERGY